MRSDPILTARRLWLTIALCCAGLVLASMVLTRLFHLHPCYLCVFQRFLFILMSAFALVAAYTRPRPVVLLLGVFVLLCAASGAGVAAYQSWLQAQPAAAFSCRGDDPNRIEIIVQWLDEHIPLIFAATGNCANKEITLFGLSFANGAFLSFILGLLATVAAMRAQRSK